MIKLIWKEILRSVKKAAWEYNQNCITKPHTVHHINIDDCEERLMESSLTRVRGITT